MAQGLWWIWDKIVGLGSHHAISEEIPTVTPLGVDDLDPVSFQSEILPVPTFRRMRPTLPVARVTTLSFGSPPVLRPVASRETEKTHAPSRRIQPVSRRKPPDGMPLRDRLQSLLQPPLDVLIGDNRLFLPFDPFPYQYEGIGYLSGSWGAILADEMGLGKTMQSVMAIRLLLRAGMIQSALLVCPKPLVSNWKREFSLWAEEIPITSIPSESWSRKNFWLNDRTPVKIANYESLSRDVEIVNSSAVSFDLVVLDEAQRIKNRDSKISSVVHGLKRKRSWALTGTPVENRAEDLISLLDFVHNRRTIVEHDPDAGRPDLLRDAVAEVILRRTKDLVMDDLPARMTRDVYVDLGPEQRARYDSAEKDGVVKLGEMGEEITIEHVFKLIGQLKQICNFDPATGESAKAEQLEGDLDEVIQSGKKGIIFSQYVSTLDELSRRLKHLNPLSYHGMVPHSQRDEILRQFREDKDRPILLLSYGTGAVGLNLQFSNYVFLYDRWWNPAIEDQAINRAHRIGQKDRVFVTRYICPNTIEARIAQVLDQKRELFSFLIDGHSAPQEGLGLSADEIFGLFDLKVRSRNAA